MPDNNGDCSAYDENYIIWIPAFSIKGTLKVDSWIHDQQHCRYSILQIHCVMKSFLKDKHVFGVFADVQFRCYGPIVHKQFWFPCNTFHVRATNALYTISLMALRRLSGIGDVTATTINIHLHLLKATISHVIMQYTINAVYATDYTSRESQRPSKTKIVWT